MSYYNAISHQLQAPRVVLITEEIVLGPFFWKWNLVTFEVKVRMAFRALSTLVIERLITSELLNGHLGSLAILFCVYDLKQ
jgi:hypothetical protein